MKIATFILGLALSVVLFLQTCAVYSLSGLADTLSEKPSALRATTASAGGIFVAFLSIIAMAFVLGKPSASAIIYVLAGLLSLGLSANFPDLAIWGIAMLILAVMSWFSRPKRATQQTA
mgnify:CR=1 FL=1